MRIILADHHEPALWALEATLNEEPDFECAGAVANTEDLLMLVEKEVPDLVLVDRDLPGGSIEDLIARLRTFEPRPIVIVISSDFESSRAVLKAGADAFISKGDQPDWLLEKLHKFARQIRKEI